MEQSTVAVQRPAFWWLADEWEDASGRVIDLVNALNGALPDDERASIEADLAIERSRLDSLGKQLAGKVDDICAVVRRIGDDIAMLKDEEKRIADRRRHAEAGLERLKAYVIASMGESKMMRTTDNTLRVQANGGLAPLEVDMTVLSPEYQYCLARVPLVDWAELSLEYLAVEMVGKPEADGSKIRAALAKPCQVCDGKDAEHCAACAGDGKARLHGAKLLPRGKHLRVE